jgi:TIR domain-containing protein
VNIRPKIFLSYAHEDHDRVKKVYDRLRKNNCDLFFDKKSIVGGEQWSLRVREEIKESNFFAVFLSQNSVAKSGYLNREIKEALEHWEEHVKDDIFIIPLRIEECKTPSELARFQRIDLHKRNWWAKLNDAIQVGIKRREERKRQVSIEEESIAFLRGRFRLQKNSTNCLNELIKNLGTLIGAVSVLNADKSWATDRYITFISGLLNSVLDRNAMELKALLTTNCRLKFPKNAAEMADQILAEQMNAMQENDAYDVISDIPSWRNEQLSRFHLATEQAVTKKGVSVRRVFNLDWTSDDPEPPKLKSDEISNILLEHLRAANQWKDRTNTRRYEVRVFRSSKLTKFLSSFNRNVRKAHFGLFRHKSKRGKQPKEVYVRFRVPESHLQEMILNRQQATVKDDLVFFDAFWHASTRLTKNSIRRISQEFGRS